MSDKFGMMDNAYFTGKVEILRWLNTTLKLNLTKIEQACTGAVYCQIIDAIHLGKVKMTKINWKATLEHEFISNLKILQQALINLGIPKEIDIQKLAKGKYQDNFEFLQWLKGYFDNKCPDLTNYNPEKRRNYAELLFGQENERVKSKDIGKENTKSPLLHSVPLQKNKVNPSFGPGHNCNNIFSIKHNRSQSKEYLTSDKLITCIDKVNIEGINSNNKCNSRSNSKNNSTTKLLISNIKLSNSKSNTFTPIQEIIPSREDIEKEIAFKYEEIIKAEIEEKNKYKREVATLKMLLAEVGREKEFYYSKLRDFEFLVNKPSIIDKNGMINLMGEILYADKEIELIIDQYGNPSIKQFN